MIFLIYFAGRIKKFTAALVVGCEKQKGVKTGAKVFQPEQPGDCIFSYENEKHDWKTGSHVCWGLWPSEVGCHHLLEIPLIVL